MLLAQKFSTITIKHPATFLLKNICRQNSRSLYSHKTKLWVPTDPWSKAKIYSFITYHGWETHDGRQRFVPLYNILGHDRPTKYSKGVFIHKTPWVTWHPWHTGHNTLGDMWQKLTVHYVRLIVCVSLYYHSTKQSHWLTGQQTSATN